LKTFQNLKDEIARIKSTNNEGLDNNWLLRKFARDQALIAKIEEVLGYKFEVSGE